jgi:hypothetical protein
MIEISLSAGLGIFYRVVMKTEKDWQKRCLEIGFEYWRAPDSHGVTCTKEQSIELLQEFLGVEVEIEPDLQNLAANFDEANSEEVTKQLQVGGSALNELLGSEIIERSAKALFESESHPMLAAAGYATDWDGQPLTLKLDYRRKARTVIKAAIGA